jgi:hypothetical protein
LLQKFTQAKSILNYTLVIKYYINRKKKICFTTTAAKEEIKFGSGTGLSPIRNRAGSSARDRCEDLREFVLPLLPLKRKFQFKFGSGTGLTFNTYSPIKLFYLHFHHKKAHAFTFYRKIKPLIKPK